ncbi:DUF6771 family protein [Sphingomonas sp. CCH18-H6]|uniref:DUF6771 family protein n=1 Tax=Sphingomonas sp. CCH18-H6 TaxID=1768787 RepID=UPI002F9174CB
MSIELHGVVRTAIAKAPQWVRQDLLSKDPTLRERAEEALAEMVANAIGEICQDPSKRPEQGPALVRSAQLQLGQPLLTHCRDDRAQPLDRDGERI